MTRVRRYFTQQDGAGKSAVFIIYARLHTDRPAVLVFRFTVDPAGAHGRCRRHRHYGRLLLLYRHVYFTYQLFAAPWPFSGAPFLIRKVAITAATKSPSSESAIFAVGSTRMPHYHRYYIQMLFCVIGDALIRQEEESGFFSSLLHRRNTPLIDSSKAPHDYHILITRYYYFADCRSFAADDTRIFPCYFILLPRFLLFAFSPRRWRRRCDKVALFMLKTMRFCQ